MYALDARTVLRRYRRRNVPDDEVAVMRYARAQAYPVPNVIDVRGPDMVMERADGPTMRSELRLPWRILAHARLLADLHSPSTGSPRPIVSA